MKKIFLSLFFLPFILLSQQTISDSIYFNGIYRTFITYIPSIYQPSQPAPLLFNLHGRTGTAYSTMWHADFRPIADTANFIIVHPQGLLDNTGVTHWNIGQSSVDDIGFIEALYQKLISDYNIDLDKVYSAGMSNGGYMSYYLACDMSDKIAAIASVTGAMSSYTQIICNPVHPTPVMEIHGTYDFTVPFNDIISGLEYWRDYNNCDLIADTTLIPDIVSADLSTVEHIVYNNGSNGVTTELFKVIGGGHTWPGSNFSTGVTNYDIDACVEIWKFFSRYDINGLIQINTKDDDNFFIDDNKLIRIVNILGHDVVENINTLLFYVYENGQVAKRVILK